VTPRLWRTSSGAPDDRGSCCLSSPAKRRVGDDAPPPHRHKADLNLLSARQETALHVALRVRHTGIVRLLLANGSSASIPNAMHDTVAQLVLKLRPPAVEITDLVLAHSDTQKRIDPRWAKPLPPSPPPSREPQLPRLDRGCLGQAAKGQRRRTSPRP